MQKQLATVTITSIVQDNPRIVGTYIARFPYAKFPEDTFILIIYIQQLPLRSINWIYILTLYVNSVDKHDGVFYLHQPVRKRMLIQTNERTVQIKKEEADIKSIQISAEE